MHLSRLSLFHSLRTLRLSHRARPPAPPFFFFNQYIPTDASSSTETHLYKRWEATREQASLKHTHSHECVDKESAFHRQCQVAE